MRRWKLWTVSAVLAAAGCMGDVGTSGQSPQGDPTSTPEADIPPSGMGGGTFDTYVPNDTQARRPGTNGISYHGGPVMTAGVHAYLIWYGSWSSTDQSILTNLVQNIGGSPYFNINTTYYDGSGTHVANAVSLSGQSSNNYSLGKALTDANIQQIVAATNPTDTGGVYFVMTAADVNETSGFCTQYCGWHTHGSINGRDIKYAFIGNPARCPSSCTTGQTPPNGSVGADGAASIWAHENEEAASDPDLNAWYDNRGEENADKCAWTFGTTYTTANGGVANVKFGSRDYLIQRNWVNAGGGSCAMSF